MANDFQEWLNQYGLVEAFTTQAGDTLYTNRQKKFGVLRKKGEYGVQSFYLDDIVGLNVYDDENLIVEWDCLSSLRALPRSTRFSTNEVYMEIRLKNQFIIRLQIFRAVNDNISRDSNDHVRLYSYACQLAQIVYNCATGR